MSFPNIPDVNASINISDAEAVNLLLASIAFEELGLAHIINAEAEKLQYVLGTIENQVTFVTPTIDNLLDINESLDKTLRNVIKKEMLLQFKLEDSITISTTASTTTTSTTTTTTTTTSYVEAGSAWGVGIEYGQGNAQYFTLETDENVKTVVLGLGNGNIPIGSVMLIRAVNDLFVYFMTDSPYIMNQTHLYVDDVVPTNSAPGSFPYQHTVTDPADYFETYMFTVDISDFAGETIYVAAHAHLLQVV